MRRSEKESVKEVAKEADEGARRRGLNRNEKGQSGEAGIGGRGTREM